VVLVTDGQVGNEDQILDKSTKNMSDIRIHTVGIDRAVNAGFLGRLAAAGGGRCELVESEDRLDDAMAAIHRRIGSPVVTGLTLTTSDLSIVDGTVTPARLPDLYPGVPLVVTGRYDAQAAPGAVLAGRARDGSAWSQSAAGVVADEVALTATWARAHLRDLEDQYVTGGGEDMERRITATSLRFGVLCRFTAWLAVDTTVSSDGTAVHRVIQPVEPVSGWEETASTMVARAGMAPMMAANFATPAPPAGNRLSMRAGNFKPGLAGGIARAMGGQAPPIRQQTEADALRLIRTQAAIEADRLRSAQSADEYERRELLADLGTRLDALVRSAPTVTSLQPVRALLAELQNDRAMAVPADAFERLWTQTLRVLDNLAGAPHTRPSGPSRPGSPEPGGSGTTGSKAFWKRRHGGDD
jgi:Ca-activated chloride channel family protein